MVVGRGCEWHPVHRSLPFCAQVNVDSVHGGVSTEALASLCVQVRGTPLRCRAPSKAVALFTMLVRQVLQHILSAQ